jgi:hypothetical protein
MFPWRSTASLADGTLGVIEKVGFDLAALQSQEEHRCVLAVLLEDRPRNSVQIVHKID